MALLALGLGWQSCGRTQDKYNSDVSHFNHDEALASGKDFVVLERSPLPMEINFSCEGFEENGTEEFEYSS